MVIIPNLLYYHIGNDWLWAGSKHELGFNYEDIPARKYLRLIAEENGISFFDTYQCIYENKIDTRKFFIHPRYGYYTAIGSGFQADFFSKVIEPYLRKELR
jgi:hypothetical protein